MIKEHKITILSVLLIAVLGFAVYANSLKGEFIWDDKDLVRDNAYIKSFSGLKNIFTENISAGAGKEDSFFRPLQIFTYMLDYRVWRLNVLGYHLTNTALHILVGLTVYWLVSLLYKDFLISLFCGLLFIVHPIHTESVSYISGRADMLSSLFLILSLIFYIKHLKRNNFCLYILIILSFVLALLSKEISLILPLVLILYHYAFREKLNLKALFLFPCIAFIYIVLRLTFLRELLKPTVLRSDTSLIQRLPGSFVALASYLRLLILPFGLHVEYLRKLFLWTDLTVISGIFITVFLLIYLLIKRKNKGLVFFSISWFFLGLLPQSNLFPINAYMAEHWLYLPSVGFFLIIANIFTRFLRLPRFKRFPQITIAIFIIFISFYSFLTIRQNNYWRSPIAFYKRTLKYAPDSLRIHNHLGLAYAEEGNHLEAMASYKKAIEYNPDYPDSYYNAGISFYALGRYQEAVDSYRKAIELNSKDCDIYNNLGNAYYALGNLNQAETCYAKAIELKSDYDEGYHNLGLVYFRLEKNTEAISMFEKAIEINPLYAEAYNGLGSSLWASNRDKEAIEAYKKALKLKPGQPMFNNNLALVYYHIKEYDLAVKYADRALELGLEVNPKFLQLLAPYRNK